MGTVTACAACGANGRGVGESCRFCGGFGIIDEVDDCGCEWTDCDACGGEGYFDWETLQFEDPLWYDPDDTEVCHQCDGKGGWLTHRRGCSLAAEDAPAQEEG